MGTYFYLSTKLTVKFRYRDKKNSCVNSGYQLLPYLISFKSVKPFQHENVTNILNYSTTHSLTKFRIKI